MTHNFAIAQITPKPATPATSTLAAPASATSAAATSTAARGGTGRYVIMGGTHRNRALSGRPNQVRQGEDPHCGCTAPILQR